MGFTQDVLLYIGGLIKSEKDCGRFPHALLFGLTHCYLALHIVKYQSQFIFNSCVLTD